MSCTFWNLRRRMAQAKKADTNATVQEEKPTEENKPVKKAGAKNDSGTNKKS